ncbi:AAA family ATPase [Streptomyces cyaneofuscatus]|uniref:AAA family ATPase n=1 Tax=Streptomyces cyaneofuscatus TaxID=66883 RepID=UPI0013DD4D79|nr:adenylyl-sulfate kinase [Streptomyces cyaneofuscatus]NDZ63429.1 adenylyl-sulfate kinase [Streptomyces cyaneofuscatus]
MFIVIGGLPGTGKTTVGYALAGDHLRQGLSVIAESVNPLAVTRDAWRDVGLAAGVPAVEVEVVCSDAAEHRRRIATRSSDIPGLPQPDRQQTLDRDYQPWDREHVVVDTAGQEPQESLASLVRRLHV